MAWVETRITRTTQPQDACGVDWNNPLTQGLFAASTGRGDGFGFARVPGASQKATAGGLVLVAPGSAGYASTLTKSVSSNQWTLFAKVSQPSASGFTSAFGIYGGATSRIAMMFRAFSSANFGADARPYVSDYNSGTALAAQREYVLSVLISDARDTIELFVDGVLVSSSAKFTRNTITVSQLEFFVKNLTSDSATAGATLGVFGAFSRELTHREIAEVSRNPWQIFEPEVQRIWIDAATEAAPPGDPTGILSATETGSDTAVLSGQIVVQGTLAASDTGQDTASIVGKVIVTGTLAAQETGSDSAAINGSAAVTLTGTLAATEQGSDTSTLTGKVLVQGSLAATEVGSDTALINGSSVIITSGTLNATETGGDSASMAGKVLVTGAVSGQELGSDTASLAGAAAVTGVRYWNGATWAYGTLRYWNGSMWSTGTLRYWNGTNWSIP